MLCRGCFSACVILFWAVLHAVFLFPRHGCFMKRQYDPSPEECGQCKRGPSWTCTLPVRCAPWPPLVRSLDHAPPCSTAASTEYLQDDTSTLEEDSPPKGAVQFSKLLQLVWQETTQTLQLRGIVSCAIWKPLGVDFHSTAFCHKLCKAVGQLLGVHATPIRCVAPLPAITPLLSRSPSGCLMHFGLVWPGWENWAARLLPCRLQQTKCAKGSSN